MLDSTTLRTLVASAPAPLPLPQPLYFLSFPRLAARGGGQVDELAVLLELLFRAPFCPALFRRYRLGEGFVCSWDPRRGVLILFELERRVWSPSRLPLCFSKFKVVQLETAIAAGNSQSNCCYCFKTALLWPGYIIPPFQKSFGRGGIAFSKLKGTFCFFPGGRN